MAEIEEMFTRVGVHFAFGANDAQILPRITEVLAEAERKSVGVVVVGVAGSHRDFMEQILADTAEVELARMRDGVMDDDEFHRFAAAVGTIGRREAPLWMIAADSHAEALDELNEAAEGESLGLVIVVAADDADVAFAREASERFRLPVVVTTRVGRVHA